MMQNRELNIEVEHRCISLWKRGNGQWKGAKRAARVTLFIDSDDQFVIVVDPLNGFWFLPGGEIEPNESIEETAKREAIEELGWEIKVNRILHTYHVTLISKETKEQLKIHPFIAVYATYKGGLIKSEYAPNRKIVLIRKDAYKNLLQDFDIPEEYECMKVYLYISKETIQEFFNN